jgi:hypothetical protein
MYFHADPMLSGGGRMMGIDGRKVMELKPRAKRLPLASALSAVALLIAACVPLGSRSGGARLDPESFPTRDEGALQAVCAPVTFIVSFNDDDDDGDRKLDFRQDKPPAQDDNLREIVFPVVNGTDEVYVSAPVLVQDGTPAVGLRLRAWTAARNPFGFNQSHGVPVTLYLEGMEASPSVDEIGFEYQYKKAGDPETWLCGGHALGTVIDVNAGLDVSRSGEAHDLQPDGSRERKSGSGSSFKSRRKMLVFGTGETDGSVTPVMPSRWTYSGGRFADPNALVTTFTAGGAHTPVADFDRTEMKLTVESGTQRIVAHFPVNLTAPLHLSTRHGGLDAGIGWLDANSGRFTPVPRTRITYRILDQQGRSIRESAYAGRLPQVRENIGTVLTSPIPDVRDFIANELSWTPNWKSKPGGEFTDRIEVWNMDKADVVVSPNPGRQVFHTILRDDAPGNPDSGVLMHVPAGSHHVWHLGVNENETAEGTQNDFSSVVVRRRPHGGDIQITLRTRYVINTP